MTGFVEWVVPAQASSNASARIRQWLTDLGLAVIEQDEARAFAVNRMLLPIQNECFTALRAGVTAARVDEASMSKLLPSASLRSWTPSAST